MKKVITGHDDNGKAIFHQVEEQKANVSLPSVVWHEVWATHASDSLPIDMSESQSRDQYSDIHQVFPAQRQSLFRVLDFLPVLLGPVELPEKVLPLNRCKEFCLKSSNCKFSSSLGEG